MDQKPLAGPGQRLEALSVYGLELFGLLAALALYKKGDRSLAVFLSHPAGIVFLVAGIGLMASGLAFAYGIVKQPPPRARSAIPPIVLNLISVAIAFATAEVAIRVLARDTPQGPMFANTLLLPFSWERVAARSRAALAQAARGETFLVFDADLGWTIGPSRKTRDYNWGRLPAGTRRNPTYAPADDIYLSSVEGMRAPRAGMSFAAERPTPKHRIALVGDSFTFGLEVRYDDTWGAQLERVLGGAPQFQVLNFGVDGYGVDQAYLRYQRDVMPWHPDVVVLGVINDDLRRTLCVYGFLCFPGFDMPFPKPRLVRQGGALAMLNRPLPLPDSLFTTSSIGKVPFIEYDPSFDPVEWRQAPYDHSYVMRLVLSKFRRWSAPAPAAGDSAMRDVNGEILRAFTQQVRANGSVPIVVFFPSLTAFEQGRTPANVAQQVLQAQHIAYLDMTDCVRSVPATDRFVTLHYSAATSSAVAGCLRDSILGALASPQMRGGRRAEVGANR